MSASWAFDGLFGDAVSASLAFFAIRDALKEASSELDCGLSELPHPVIIRMMFKAKSKRIISPTLSNLSLRSSSRRLLRVAEKPFVQNILLQEGIRFWRDFTFTNIPFSGVKVTERRVTRPW